MSVLETPRLYFKGNIAWDPITTNNYDSNYDEFGAQTIFPGVTERVKAFRERAVATVGTGGNWNPHGTHRSTFYDTAVCGVDLGHGVQAQDPFVSAAVNFTGMLVDLEPYGAFTSQLFHDGMRFGVEGGYCINAPRTSRVIDRYINFGRNQSGVAIIAGIASVVWQTSFAKADGLRIDPFDSPALQALAHALENDDVLGLTVRFNTYRTVYYNDPTLTRGSDALRQAGQALIDKLNEGGFQPNPARSLLVGVIGLWRNGEPAQEPGERVLAPGADSPLGTAFARIQGESLTLDLANSVPEVDTHLTKMDLGTLAVSAVDPVSSAITPLATIPYTDYNRCAYEASAGMVTVALTPDTARLAATQDLQIADASGQTVLLKELPLRAIPDTPDLYLNEGERATARFCVYERGERVASKVPLTLYQMTAGGGNPDNTVKTTTGLEGLLELPLIGASSGITAYVPSFSQLDGAGQGINPLVNTYMYVRSLPADSAVAALQPTWENVYTHVLANWNAMAPCMDNWLRLDDPAQVLAYAGVIKRLTDPKYFEEFRFMPVTRDMTAGQRALLYRFLDGPGATDMAVESAPAQPPKPDEPRPNAAQLSRAMRRM